MPSNSTDASIDMFDSAASHFLAAVEVPRTTQTIDEWFANKRAFTPHAGQRQVLDAIATPGVHEIDVVAGKRAGKSRLVIEIALYYIIGLGKRVWVLGPTWDIVDRIFQPLWRLVQKESNVVIDRNKMSRMMRTASGGLLEGVSWASPEQIEGEGVQVVITDESQYLTRPIHDKIRARLVGDWLWIRIGSPAEGGSSFYEEMAETNAMAKIPSHRLIHWATWENPDADVQATVAIAKEDLTFLLDTMGKDHPVYTQRKRWYDGVYGGESVPSTDIVFSGFDKDIHVSSCPFDEDLPVYLGIDPGHYPGYYAVTVFQPHVWGTKLGTITERTRNQHELWQIDEVYVQRQLSSDVINACRAKPWWRNVTKAVMDVASRKSNIQTGNSELGLWQDKTTFPVFADWVAITDGISAHRRWLAGQRIFHDKDACPNTIREYGLYKLRSRQAGDSRETPVDRFNHAMKSIAYLLVTQYGNYDDVAKPITWKRALSYPKRRMYA